MGNRNKILLIDSEPEKITGLMEFFKTNFQFINSETIAESINIIDDFEPDVILLEKQLRDGSYIKLINILNDRQAHPHIPVIMLTDSPHDDDEISVLESGVDDFIRKDVNEYVLKARIKNIIKIRKEILRRKIIEEKVVGSSISLENEIKSKIFELEEVQDDLKLFESSYRTIIDDCKTSSKCKKILIVDDKPDNIHILIENLEKDYDLFFATSGKKALEIAFSNQDLDLILLDLMMPEMNGYEVCKRLNDPKTWHIPIIILTSSTQEIDEIKSLDMGAVDYISKPFHIPIVKARIKVALRLKEEMDKRKYVTNRLNKLNQELEFKVKEKARELQLAHDSLLESERKYREIYENSVEGIFISNPESECGEFLSVSPSLARILGYESSQDLLSSIDSLRDQVYVNREDFERFRKQIDENGEVSNFIVSYYKKDGSVIWVNISARTISDPEENKKYYQGFLIDVTENKKIERDNTMHMEELALLNSIIAKSLKLTKAEAILKSACNELGTLYGLPVVAALLYNSYKDEIKLAEQYICDAYLSEKINTLMDGARCGISDRCFDFFSSIKTPEYFFNEQFPDGYLKAIPGIRYYLVVPIGSANEFFGWIILCYPNQSEAQDFHCSFARSVCDQIAGALGRIKIEDERFQLEALYHQSQKMEALGKFTSGVAHDFNNILSVIIAEAEILNFAGLQPDECTNSIKQIMNASRKAVDLVKQLLAFSRKQILKVDLIDVNEVIDNFSNMIGRIIGEKIVMKNNLQQGIMEILIDKGQLEQVLMNLVVNARDAMPEGGILTISTRQESIGRKKITTLYNIEKGDYVVIEIKDTGKGMDEKTMRHMFEPFYTTKEVGAGTGLGLSTVHGIVTQSGGFVDVDSTPGEGTVFRIYFPVIGNSEIQARIIEEKKTVLGGKETIAVIEDDEIMANLLNDMLSGIGYTVYITGSETEIKKLMKDKGSEIDLIISDIILPGNKNGVSICNDLLRYYPEIRVLYISGYSEDAIREKGVMEGSFDFMKKPFSISDLDERIRSIFES